MYVFYNVPSSKRFSQTREINLEFRLMIMAGIQD